MICKGIRIVLIVGGLLLATLPARAHHALHAQFDFEKPIELKGMLTKMEWISPHSWMNIEVTNADGTKTVWTLETLNPTRLRERGLGRASQGGLKVGDTYVINGYAARNGKSFGFIRQLTMPDGRVITLWFGDPNA